MKSSAFPILAMFLSAAAFAYERPQVTGQVVSQTGGRRLVVDYTLSASAIVLVDIKTNGVAVSRSAIGELANADTVMSAGTHRIVWRPNAAYFPGDTVDGVTVELSAYPKDDPPDYCVVDVTREKTYRFYRTAEDIPGGLLTDFNKTDRLVMRRVHAANRSFRMGRGRNLSGYSDDSACHLVSFTNDWYMGVFELTQGQVKNFSYGFLFWDSRIIREPNGLDATSDVGAYPINFLSYHIYRSNTNGYAASAYKWPQNGRKVKPYNPKVVDTSVIGYLNYKTGLHFDLPTEAEWEYTCRAGHETELGDGNDASDACVDAMAWTSGNTVRGVHAVGFRKPNSWGFYDMHGNINEMCLDWYADYALSGGEMHPTGPGSGSAGHVRRGGHYWNGRGAATSYIRNKAGESDQTDYLGVRLWMAVEF